MRKIASLAAVGLLAAALAIPSSQAVADGPECDVANHCYGVIDYASGNIDAVGLELWTDCLHLDTPLVDNGVHQMWMWTGTSPITWIEAGYIRGIVAGGDTESFFRWYWAEYTGSAYYSHFIAWATVNQWWNMTFSRLANGHWGIYYGGLGGTKVGETAQTATAGVKVQVGAETTEPKVYSRGKSRYLLYHSIGAPYWTAASPGTPLVTSGVYSVTQSGNAMEQTSLQGICGSAPAAAAKRAPTVAPTEAELKKTALAVAQGHGEKAPADLQAVSTKREAAQRAVGAGDKLDSDQGVYLLQMRGSFVGRAPKGAPLPRGNTLTVTVDAATGEVTDLSIGHERTDLAKLGPVKKL